MRSIKPGRGPSMMGGVMSIFVAAFGVIWTLVAFSMGAGPFGLFGIIFIIVAIVQAVYHFKNATGKNRYSTFDITDQDEEPDPLNQRFGAGRDDFGTQSTETTGKNVFCPYCGAKLEGDFAFCNQCGRKLP